MGVPVDLDREAGVDQGDERGDDDREQRQVPGVDDMGAGQRRPRDRRPPSLGDEDGGDDGEEAGARPSGPAPFAIAGPGRRR